MLIGVPLETAPGETRVAVTPETLRKLKAQGHVIRVQSGAGVAASATDQGYAAAGAEITDRAGAFGVDLVLKVRSPSAEELPMMKTGAAVVGMLNPFDQDNLHRLAGAGVVGFALEAAPVFIIDSSLCSGERTLSTRSQPKAPVASVISAPTAS